MTYSKINTILKKYFGSDGIGNGWMKLPESISVIYLNQDPNIYIRQNQIFFFNGDDESLEISEDDSYIENFDPKGTYPVHTKVQFSDIAGFITSSVEGPYGAYIRKR